jgi:O-antigen ligase
MAHTVMRNRIFPVAEQTEAGGWHEEEPRAPSEGKGPPTVGGLGFALFIVLNAILLIRPSEIVAPLENIPLYELVICACALISLAAILGNLDPNTLKDRAIHVCALGMLPAIVLSHVSHFQFGLAYGAAYSFAKVLVYFLLFVSIMTSFERVRWFLFWLEMFIIVLVAVALLQHHGIVNIPRLEECQQRMLDDAGDEGILLRLVSTGIYNDPNDLCLILSFGILIAIYWLGDRRLGPGRFLWALPIGVFGYGIMLTHSRGGLMGLTTGIVVLFTTRFGWKKALPLIVVTLPVMLFLFAGRQTKINLSDQDDTAQGRIQIWRDGLNLFKTAPLFGIGEGRYDEEVFHVAHNSFVHSFTELGLFGGTLFSGAFFLAVKFLSKVGSGRSQFPNAEILRLQPYLLAGTLAYIVGMLSLSRAYVVPTYMMIGLASTYTLLAAPAAGVQLPGVSAGVVKFVIKASLLTLVLHYIFIRVFAE